MDEDIIGFAVDGTPGNRAVKDLAWKRAVVIVSGYAEYRIGAGTAVYGNLGIIIGGRIAGGSGYGIACAYHRIPNARGCDCSFTGRECIIDSSVRGPPECLRRNRHRNGLVAGVIGGRRLRTGIGITGGPVSLEIESQCGTAILCYLDTIAGCRIAAGTGNFTAWRLQISAQRVGGEA